MFSARIKYKHGWLLAHISITVRNCRKVMLYLAVRTIDFVDGTEARDFGPMLTQFVVPLGQVFVSNFPRRIKNP